MPVYMGERYIPGADQQIATEQSGRLRAALRRTDRSAARLLSTTWVPNEEWAFDLFEAESAGAVEEAYRMGQVGFERITEAVHVT